MYNKTQLRNLDFDNNSVENDDYNFNVNTKLANDFNTINNNSIKDSKARHNSIPQNNYKEKDISKDKDNDNDKIKSQEKDKEKEKDKDKDKDKGKESSGKKLDKIIKLTENILKKLTELIPLSNVSNVNPDNQNSNISKNSIVLNPLANSSLKNRNSNMVSRQTTYTFENENKFDTSQDNQNNDISWNMQYNQDQYHINKIAEQKLKISDESIKKRSSQKRVSFDDNSKALEKIDEYDIQVREENNLNQQGQLGQRMSQKSEGQLELQEIKINSKRSSRSEITPEELPTDPKPNTLMLDIKNRIGNIVKLRIESKIQDSLKTNLKQEADRYPGICVITNSNLNVVHTNDHFQQTFLQQSDDVLDTNFSSLFELNYRNQFTKLVQDIIDHHKTFTEKVNVSIYDKYNKSTYLMMDIKLIKNTQMNEKPQLTFYLYFDEDSKWQIIEPNSTFYLAWTFIILQFIMFLLFQLPYDVSFGGNQEFNQWLDLISVIVFVVDILLNFFVGIEENGVIIQDISIIIDTQIKSWFIMDILATIPFEWFLNITINTNILKSIKLIKMVRILRMLRIDLSMLINFSDFSKNEQGKELIQFQRRNRGFITLVKNNFYLIVASHQQCIVYFYFSNNRSTIDQVNDQLNMKFNNQLHNFQTRFNVQVFLLYENFKSSLGFSDQFYLSNLETGLALGYMILGLSLFGYGIGNISSYLNQANQSEIEQQNAVSQFTDICTQNNVDVRTQALIMSDIDRHQEKQGDKEFVNKSMLLSENILFQLESSMYRPFMDSFSPFHSLSIDTVRMIKNSCIIESNSVILRKDSQINSIQLVTKGVIKIYDDQMNSINEYHPNEIFGMEYFRELCSKKQKIDLESIFKMSDFEESQLNESILTHKNSHKRNKIKHRGSMSQVEEQMFSKKRMPTLMEDEFAKVQFKDQAIGADNPHYIVMGHNLLEDMMLREIESFLILQNITRNEFDTILPEEREIAKQNMEYYYHSKKWVIIVLKSGQVWDVNTLFSDQVSHYIQPKGKKIWEILEFDCDPMFLQANFVDQLKVGKYTLIAGMRSKVNVLNYFKHMIIRSDEDGSRKYYNYRKSMLESYIIEFEMCK